MTWDGGMDWNQVRSIKLSMDDREFWNKKRVLIALLRKDFGRMRMRQSVTSLGVPRKEVRLLKEVRLVHGK